MPRSENRPDDRDQRPSLSRSRVWILRVIYACAAANVIALQSWMLLASPDEAFGDLAKVPEMQAMRPMMVVGAIVFSGLFVFLAVRPAWWGKYLCAPAAVAWLGNGVGRLLLGAGAGAGAGGEAIHMGSPYPVMMAGAVMLVVAVLHQIIDPRPSPLNARSLLLGKA